MPPVKPAWCCQHVCGSRYGDDMRPSAQRYIEFLGVLAGDVEHVRPEVTREWLDVLYACSRASRLPEWRCATEPPALRRLVGASDHDHCRVSGEGAAAGANRLTLVDSDSAADRLRLGLVSGRVLHDRLGELLVGEVIDRALLEAGGGDLVAQHGRQTGNRRAVENGNGDVAGLDRGAVAFRVRVAGVVTAVVAGELADAVGSRAAEDEQADEGDRDKPSADPAVPGLGAPRRDHYALPVSGPRSSRLGDRPLRRGRAPNRLRGDRRRPGST